jgi:hypothetical protein
LCRAGLGAVYRQLGRYRDSIHELQFGLALARKTLDPQAEASGLIDIAVSEMALGDYRAARSGFDEAAEIDERFPRWAIRAYRYGNSAELRLVTQDPARAFEEFKQSFDLAASAELWPMTVTACAGMALCAQRMGMLRELRRYASDLTLLRAGRETVQHDRWITEAALAWDAVLNQERPDDAVRSLESAARELSRRDTDHWLSLEMELIRVREIIAHTRKDEDRRRLAETARRYEAAGIVAQAAE